MINSDSFLLTSGLIITLLISATVISFTSKFIFVSDKLKKSTNQVYDPDHGLNATAVCVLSKDAYAISYENSPCFNKTLLQWYNPWVRHDLWTGFWREIKERRRLELLKRVQATAENSTDTPSSNESVLPTDSPQRIPDVQKTAEKPNEFVYAILVGLIVISGMFACWEVCKDKLKKNGGAAAKAHERECPLADFTINRHLRRESQQQSASHLPRQASLELTAKVTQNLIHQSSLDRAFPKSISEAVTSQELRRNSMPLYLGSDFHHPTGPSAATPTGAGIKLCKRQSVDVPGEDSSLDQRKKPRHFIRRH